jgi:hypothetical protein
VALVLEQHLRLGDRAARDATVRARADLVDVRAVRVGLLEQAELELLLEDAADRVVDPGLADPPGSDLGEQRVWNVTKWFGVPSLGSMNMSTPALTDSRTSVAQSSGLSGGIWWIASQSLITKPSKPIPRFSTSVISSRWACILSGLPRPSSIQSTLENDGITLPTWCFCTAGRYWRSEFLQKSSRLVTVTPWSIL